MRRETLPDVASLEAQLQEARQALETRTRELAQARSSLNALFATLDSTRDGVVAFQFDDGSRHHNMAFVRMWGLTEDAMTSTSEDELLALQALRVLDPEQFLARIRSRRLDQDDFSVVELKDGRIFERYVAPQVSRDMVVGKVINYRDVTQRVEFERKLVFNRVVVESSGPMIWIDHSSDVVTYANRAACDLLGYRIDEVVGIKLGELDANYTREAVAPLDEELRRIGKPINFRTLYRHKAGHLRDVDVTASLTQDGDREIYVASFKDITEQKTAARESKRQQALLTALINSIPDIIAHRDPQGVFLGCNEAFSALAGKSATEVAGRTAHELFPKERAEIICARDKEVLATLQKSSLEELVTYPDGTQVYLETVRNPLRDQDGKLLGILTIGRDVTERKKAEEEVRRAKELAEEATQMKTDFLANMSHEIRTPMNAIIGLTHLMSRDSQDAAQLDRLAKVDRAAKHLLQVINDILDLSKIEAGRMSLEHTEFSLDVLLARSFELVAERAREKGLELVLDSDQLPARLRGDPTRLSQALLNLLSNAVKFTQRGWVRLSGSLVAEEGRRVQVRFEVRDTGEGIAPERRPALFGAFEQADSSMARRHGGTGLGLALTRHFAEMMGGSVGYASQAGEGSSFWITAWLERAEAEDAPRPVTLSGLRALVVDDLPEALDVLCDRLRSFGMQVDAVASGAAAEARADAGATYDVLIIDWRMEPQDGIVTLQNLRERWGDAVPPSILATAFDDAQMREQASDAGFDAVLIKPITGSALHDTLVHVLHGPGASGPGASALPAALATSATDAEAELLASHSGQRVLLAEDNPINQEVARELLRRVGLVVETAGDGRQALDMASSRPYDLVLMDMQMPEMDGIAATRAIRARVGHALPIIAMTANAFGEDRVACLDAGMNDHVVKPADPDFLYKTLLRWLPAHAGRTEPPTPARVQGPEEFPLVVPLVERLAVVDGLDLARGLLSVGGRVDVLERVLRSFVGIYGNGEAAVLRDSTAPALARWPALCHSLRGACAAIGAIALDEQLWALEQQLHAATDPRKLAASGRRLHDELHELTEQLVALLDECGA